MPGPFDELVGSRMTDPDERQAKEITRSKGDFTIDGPCPSSPRACILVHSG